MKKQGFTIVEIVIVIVVIGILAAISIVGYGSWRTSVSEKQVESDLNGVIAGMEGKRNFSEDGYPVYPAGTEFDEDNDLFQASDDVTITYVRGDSKSYCIEAVSKLDADIIFFINSANGNKEIKAGGCPLSLNNGVVTTIVNGGLNYPTGIAVDSAGYLYVAETGNNRILKIDPAGVVSVLAGGGAGGYLDATGPAARFDEPYGVAVDAAGFVYVADNGNHRIRKISPSGVVTTFAGSTMGFADGVGTAARFNDPYAVVVDQVSGMVYTTETGNHRVRSITPGQDVNSLAGSSVGYQDGTGTGARFDDPVGLALHSSGDLFAVETGSDKVRKITQAGVVTTTAGSTIGFADGIGTAARFNNPTGIGIQNNIAYIADSWGNRVRMLNVLTGQVVTLAGSGTTGDVDSVGTGAEFNFPTGIAVSSTEVVYIVESNSGQIRKIQ